MNLHELPMIIFTVTAQMCVGAFIILGVLQLWLSAKTDRRTVDRLTVPILYVIGPALILGLIASMFHMNDVMNVLNVFRNVGTSWLSREIVFGILFAGAGFLFVLMQWFRIGSTTIRQIMGLIAAVFGIGLIICMSMIYMSLTTVPAWNTWVVMFHFFATAIMLGALAVAAGQMATTMIRHNRARSKTSAPVEVPERTETAAGGSSSLATKLRVRETATEINEPSTEEEWRLTTTMVRGLAITAAIIGVLILITYIIHILDLATGTATAQQSAEAFMGGFFVVRLILLGLAAVILAVFIYRTAGIAVRENPAPLAWIVIGAFLLAFASEMMGRSLHYDSMTRIGI